MLTGKLEHTRLSANKLDLDGVGLALATELLSLFWRCANSAVLIVYRPAFMRDWADGGPYFSKLLLTAVYFDACRYLSEGNLEQVGASTMYLRQRFHERFKQLLREEFVSSRITTVQALLTTSASLSAVGKERSVAWMYSGLAFRMIFDLGLHTTNPNSARNRKASEDLEISRRLFWSAFLTDKLQSFYHGRPASIQEADTLVPLVFRDQYDELEQWVPIEPSQASRGPYTAIYTISNFSRMCKLSVIMNRVLNKIYRDKKETEDQGVITKDLNALNNDLERWRSTLPLHLDFSPGSIGQNPVAAPPPHTYIVMYAV